MASTPAKDSRTKLAKPNDNEVLEILKSLQAGQESLKARMEHNHDDIKETLEKRLADFKDYVDLEIAQMTNKYLQLEGKFHEIERLKECKHYLEDHTIVIQRLQYEKEENLEAKVQDLLSQISTNTSYVRCMRMQQRDQTHTPLVKVQFESKDSKIMMLKNKGELKRSAKYRNTYIRSSQTHEERVSRQNIDTIMKELNLQHKFRVTGSGKLVPQDPQYQQPSTWQPNEQQHEHGQQRLSQHTPSVNQTNEIPGGLRPPHPTTHPPPHYQQMYPPLQRTPLNQGFPTASNQAHQPQHGFNPSTSQTPSTQG